MIDKKYYRKYYQKYNKNFKIMQDDDNGAPRLQILLQEINIFDKKGRRIKHKKITWN